MNGIETRQYAMLVRVKDFGQVHGARFPESTAGGRAFAAVTAAVAELGGYTVSKKFAVREGLRTRKLARQVLIERLETIHRTARAIDEEAPGFDDKFDLPRRQSDEAILLAGRTFVEAAEASHARFVGHGLPETFAADLKALVDSLQQAVHDYHAGRKARAEAQEGIAKALASGLAAVRQLDVIVANQMAGDSKALAGWEQDRHVEYRTRRKNARVSTVIQ